MAYAMGRMPSIWGENAEEFRPERWLENGIFQPESPFKFIAFHVSESPSFIFFSLWFGRHLVVTDCRQYFNFLFSSAGWSPNLSRERLCLPTDEDCISGSSSFLSLQVNR